MKWSLPGTDPKRQNGQAQSKSWRGFEGVLTEWLQCLAVRYPAIILPLCIEDFAARVNQEPKAPEGTGAVQKLAQVRRAWYFGAVPLIPLPRVNGPAARD